MARKKIFFAGPSVLPVEVLEQLRDQLVDYQGKGLSMLEASHRGGMFEEMYDQCLATIRDVYHIPEDYDVYFLGGGATLQFTMIPMNFLKTGYGG
jgi:phosphoserine aminotransferase